MKNITPYRTKRGALAALDNGGRFYNVLTAAADGEITTAELAKLAGAFTDKQKMFVYLDMTLSHLAEEEAEAVICAMTPDLRAAYKHGRPAHFTPAEANLKAKASKSAIVTGVPHYVKSNADFSGFIMIPISTGKTMTMVMVPIIDHYDVYEVHDAQSEQDFLVAHARSSRRLSPTPTIMGGVIKKLQGDKKKKSKHSLFLEAYFYTAVRT